MPTLLFEGYRETNQVITAGTTKMNPDNITVNVGSAFSGGDFTVPAGYSLLEIIVSSRMVSDLSQSHRLWVDTGGGAALVEVLSTTTIGQDSSFLYRCSEGDVFSVRFTASSRTLNGSGHPTQNWMKIIGY